MKKILIKIGIMVYFCLSPLAMNQAMAESSSEFYYRINDGSKGALKMVTTPIASGRRVSWSNCSGTTAGELNQQGQECQVVTNDVNGYTGTTDVCASPIGEPLLSNSVCNQNCNGTTLSWSSAQCSGEVTTSVHNESKTISNIATQYTGSGTFVCEDGTWREQTSSCTENNPVCGSDNGQTLGSVPTNLCSFGTGSVVADNASGYSWSCINVTNTVNCTALKSPVCDNSTYQGCTVGTASAYTSAIGDSSVTWNCLNGTGTVNCSRAAVVGVSGICGSSNNGTFATAPSENLCSSGTASAVTGTTTYAWTCSGQSATQTRTAGNTVNCSANAENWTSTTPTCGSTYDVGSPTCGSYSPSATNQTTNFTQTQNCTIGRARMCQDREYETYTGTYRNVGVQYEQSRTDRSYTNNRTVTVSYTSWSTYNTSCGSWTPSTGSYPAGQSFTQNRTCSYDQERTRSYSVGGSFSETRTLSNQGESRGATGTQSASCSGSFNSCSVGNSSGYTSGLGASTVTWTCNNGTSSVGCSAPATVGSSGVCGSANGGTFSSAPSSGLCSSGTPSGVSGSSSYSWTCSGQSATQTRTAGGNASCSASGANWIPAIATCGAAYDSGSASCGGWSPDATTQTSGFTQNQSCSIAQSKSCQGREYDTVSGAYRNVGGAYVESAGTRNYNNNRSVTVTYTAWGTYSTSCSSWTPDPSTVNSGQTYTQTRSCTYSQYRERWYSASGTSLYGEGEYRSLANQPESQQATGTKAVLASCSNSSVRGIIESIVSDIVYDAYTYESGGYHQDISISSISCSGATSGSTSHGGSQSGSCSWSGTVYMYEQGHYRGEQYNSGTDSVTLTCNNGNWQH